MSVSAIMLAAWACTERPLQARIMPCGYQLLEQGAAASLASLEPMVISKPLPRAGRISGKPQGQQEMPKTPARVLMKPTWNNSWIITAKEL